MSKEFVIRLLNLQKWILSLPSDQLETVKIALSLIIGNEPKPSKNGKRTLSAATKRKISEAIRKKALEKKINREYLEVVEHDVKAGKKRRKLTKAQKREKRRAYLKEYEARKKAKLQAAQ